jgi:hypothetical protein
MNLKLRHLKLCSLKSKKKKNTMKKNEECMGMVGHYQACQHNTLCVFLMAENVPNLAKAQI